MKTGLFIGVLFIMILAVPAQAAGTPKAFPRTPSGEIRVQTIPASKLLVTRMDGSYFENANTLFRRLFNYISSNEIPMTAPVEGRLTEGVMAFYVGPGNAGRDLADQGDVMVVETPERLVASIGSSGSYREKNVMKLKERLDRWLSDNPDYEPAGEPYAVFWNPPFIPWFLRSLEVHIPVRPTEDGKP